MSENQLELDPDLTTDMEVGIDPEEELIKQCEEMWKDMEECQNKLLLTGTETLTNSNAQLSLLIMQMKCLTAELDQWNKRTPESKILIFSFIFLQLLHQLVYLSNPCSVLLNSIWWA
uniref:Centromere protein K n=1 Tax=Peromyscus maniculatus bairdii TaxID=230844 RepID=A0A8C8U4K1_PERMB